MGENKDKAYRDAWMKLKSVVSTEKTNWGRVELVERMRDILLECMEAYL